MLRFIQRFRLAKPSPVRRAITRDNAPIYNPSAAGAPPMLPEIAALQRMRFLTTPVELGALQNAVTDPASGLLTAQSTYFASTDYYKAGTRRYDLLRRAWERRVAELRPAALVVANLGTVVYVDPSSSTNGSGSFSSPRNTLPALTSNQTILLKEKTTYVGSIGVGGLTNWLLGTYDAKTGRRVIDKARLATVDAQGGYGVNISGASVNNWVSGIRVINFTFGVVKGQNASASGGGIEFCLTENAVAGVMCTCFQSLTGGSIIRFNTVNRCSGDGVWYGQNTNSAALGVQVYGNDIRLGYDDSYDGPDGIQLSSNNGEAVGQYLIHSNWVENTRNRKQVIIATYNNTLTSTDSMEVYGNFCFGGDTSLPQIGSNPQNGIYSEIPNTRVWANYVENSRYPIVVTNTSNPSFVNGAQVFGNLIVVNMVGKLRAAIEANSVAGSGVLARICNNTIIGIACGGAELTNGVLPAISSLGPADIRNNAIVGTFWNRTIQVNAANAGGGNLIEQGNAFDSGLATFVFDSGTGATTPSATDWVGAELWLDEFYRSIPGSPLDYGGTPAWGQLRDDPYGRSPMGVVGAIGACHPVRDAVSPAASLPLAQNALGNYVGAWVPISAHRMYTRFAAQLAGGGVLTLTIKGKLLTDLDSAAATLNTITLGGGGAQSSVGTVVDMSAKDLVRVELTGYNAHGVVDALLAA